MPGTSTGTTTATVDPGPDVAALRAAGLVVHAPGDPAYDTLASGFNLDLSVSPAAVVEPTDDRAYTFVGEAVDRSGMARATLAPRLGTATTVIAFNAGTIAAGQALEARGAFGARKNPLTATRLAGLVVIFLGVLAVRLL